MDLNGLINSVMNLLQSYDLAVIIVILGLAVLVYAKPKPMLKMGAMVLAIAVVFYLISLMGDMTFTGVAEKERMVHQTP